MKIVQEFREFISRGSVIDLAVGVIIGAAFSKIVSALVDDVIMPVVGLVTTGVDFGQLKVVLREASGKQQPEVAIHYGSFINAIVQFVIVALTVFLLVKAVNMLRRFTARQDEEAKASAPEPAPTPTDALLMEIRDLLRGDQAVAPRQKRSTAAKSK